MDKIKQKCSRQRESWIDVLKGIGIILVVIGHTSQNNYLVNWIYTFHMPLFFTLSGYLWNIVPHKNVSFGEFAIKRVKTILWPFILFRTLLILYWGAVESHFRTLDLGPIWFLIVLFVVELVAFLIFYDKQENIRLNIMVLLIAIGLLILLKEIFGNNSTIMSWIIRGINGFIWYVAGQFIGCVVSRTRGKCGNRGRCVVLAVLLVASVIVCALNGNVSMWSNDFGNYGLYIIGNLTGTLFVALLCKWFWNKNNLIEFLGQNTIIILATHEPIKRVILKVVEVASEGMDLGISIDMMQNNIAISLIVVVGVIMINVLVIMLFREIKKRTPLFVKKNLLIFVR